LGYLTEARLIEHAQNGDVAARNTVWCSHLRLAMSAVNEFHIPRPLVPDAFQEAAIGLEQAIMRYEVRRFLSFSTYAWYWITQRVRRLLTSHRSPIRIPDYLHRKFAHFSHERKACRGPGEWFDWFDSWSSRDCEQFLSLVRVYHLTHDPPSEADLLAHASADDRHQSLAPDEKRMIHQALRALPEREKSILEQRFGLNGNGEVILENIGQELGLTRERVRQIQQEALRTLQTRLANYLNHDSVAAKGRIDFREEVGG
jgi:RNA polymerase sigma factor (sigma-70 family)